MKIYTDEEMEIINNVFDLIALRFNSNEFSNLVREIKELIKENQKYAREIEKLNKELTHKTEQYEYLRHYHNLDNMKQYPIERDLFCSIFGELYDRFYNHLFDTTTCNFKCWYYDDEFYILHLPSGTLINWYKHLGRCNTCSKELSIEEYKKLANDLYKELKDEVI